MTRRDQRIVAWAQATPKVELHLHLEGAIPLDTLWQLVTKYGGDPELPAPEALQRRFGYRGFPPLPADLAQEEFVPAAVVIVLDGVCIETACKRRHRALVRQLLSAQAQPEGDEESAELLRTFLETEDFGLLRAREARLSGRERARVRIEAGPDGRPRWTLI